MKTKSQVSYCQYCKFGVLYTEASPFTSTKMDLAVTAYVARTSLAISLICLSNVLQTKQSPGHSVNSGKCPRATFR